MEVIEEVTLEENSTKQIKNKVEEEQQGQDFGGLMLASNGVAYNADNVLWANIGANKHLFMRYHQEFQKAYQEVATDLHNTYGAMTKVKPYGIQIDVYGKQYIFSKDYVTGQNLIAGDDTVFANYIINTYDLEDSRIRGKYLTAKEVDEVKQVAVEQFIILPTEQDMRLKERIMTLSLNRPKDWIKEMQAITERLGLAKPRLEMEKGDIEVFKNNQPMKRISWKYDKESVKELILVMCTFWEEDSKSNRKPNNKVVRGGGITLVNLTKEQRDYREYINEQIKQAVGKSKYVSSVYKVNFSNTTTSCYVDFTYGEYDLHISIRDHEEMHEKGYYRFYIDAVGQEEFSNRLARIMDKLVKTNKMKQ